MKRKVVALFLATCMAATLTACGGNDTSADKTANNDAADDADGADDAAGDDAEGADDAAGDDAEGGDDAADGMLTIGFSQVGAESDWRTANSASMKETFSEANGYNLIFDDAQQKQENQIAAIRNFIQQEVDYIVLAPVTETGWDTVLQEAYDAGIPVVIVDRMVNISNDDLYTAWVGSNFQLEGEKACAWLDAYAQATGKGDEQLNIIDIQGTIGASAQIGRTAGLEAAIEAHDNWTLLEAQSGEFTQAKGQEVMESLLKQYDDIDVVYCENDNEAFGAIDAIEQAGKTVGKEIGKDILVMSFDSTNAGLTDVLSGKIICNTECNPLHGPRVEEIIKKLEAGEEVEKQQFVDEEIFAGTEDVPSIKVADEEYAVTTVTQEVIDGRAY
ncbi:HTH-type transcriptional repressor PurR [Eubacterium plexicaudatum ASF492]|uniref:Periplasmic binding protein domain-containing protein n=1 Tax=Eubacterium plexicaudatum ASF492 TaxID=1235802 RepID=N2BGA9_9FIRM|nr:HTH-type transcriptional repressor PurR [Eubacterium plexicaudatum ASF492]